MGKKGAYLVLALAASAFVLCGLLSTPAFAAPAGPQIVTSTQEVDDGTPIGTLKLLNHYVENKNVEGIISRVDLDEATAWMNYFGNEVTREEMEHMMQEGFEEEQVEPLELDNPEVVYEKGPYVIVRSYNKLSDEDKEWAEADYSVVFHFLIKKDGVWKYFAQQGAYVDNIEDESMEEMEEYVTSRLAPQ
jgi:hypothetical protein